jgi:hypothetical protein
LGATYANTDTHRVTYAKVKLPRQLSSEINLPEIGIAFIGLAKDPTIRDNAREIKDLLI